MNTTELRQSFLNYFRKNNHKFMRPSKVYIDDPTLFFVNAGMNQLKNIFLGEELPKDNNDRLMNYQLCIRAGGKHNDLDDVGFDSYHLTSFEMLGNWSLDNYWKEESIDLAFKYLLEECKLDPKRMYVTYYEGNNDENILNKDVLDKDVETINIWKKYLPEDRIIPGIHEDNFWMMGTSGPCGKSTEIHYDISNNEERFVPELVNKDDPTVVEIWNLVFIEFMKDDTGFHKLNKRFVDTGMGLERLSMILQKKSTIYQTDAFRYIIGCAQMITNSDYFCDTYNVHNKDYKTDTAYRIFADHMRTTVMCLYHGVEFDSTKRGFILRKIFRRLLTYSYVNLLKCNIKPIMNHLAIKGLISGILNYFLQRKHDADIIWKKLIEEEIEYYDKIRTTKSKYKKQFKKIKDHDKTIEKLKESCGIDPEISILAEKIVIV